MHPTLMASMLLAMAGLATADQPQAIQWDFEDATVGKLPAGWTSAKTGEGPGSAWRVVEDKTAPRGANVLAQSSSEGPRPLFNLCVAENTRFKDLEVSVAFKAVQGKVDQGGGIAWRYQDAGNYYIARFNPLENNYRLYKVVAGKRIQLATSEDLKAPAGEWHALAIKMTGDQMECHLNGKKELEAKDDTFTRQGKVGLWTKADAQTSFDNFTVREVGQ